jgi:hypothetical protein
MIQRTLIRNFLRPSVVIDFPRRGPIVIDPIRGLPVTINGSPAWLTSGRSRPRYFDGRFLAARDLERDQEYFAARQLELLRAAAPGVIHGLDVTAKDQTTLVVGAGVGVTASGDLIVLRDGLEVPLADDATTQRLDEAFGLLSAPREIARRRTGVYVLLARPVTFTGDPVALYPASIDDRRDPEDGDVIEAVALSLVPYHDAGISVDPARQRAELAKGVFVGGRNAGAPVDALPLAAVQLERGFVRWIDSWLVRREIGVAHEGMGAYARGPRALAEAHVQQYTRHLQAIGVDRQAAGKPAAFVAPEELAALPPVGPYPVGALDLRNASERFFPTAMPSRVQVVAEDELATLLEEQLALPPIDLSAGAEELAATPVAVILPVPRAKVAPLPPELRSFPLRAAAVVPGRVRLRGVMIGSILERFMPLTIVDDRGGKLADALGTIDTAYYVRLRRAVASTGDGVVPIVKTVS